jgi:hypothetical protein
MAKNVKPNTIEKVQTINSEAGKERQVELLCVRNTFLPDGTFIAAKSRIWVDSDYAKRVAEEQNPSFTILN